LGNKAWRIVSKSDRNGKSGGIIVQVAGKRVETEEGPEEVRSSRGTTSDQKLWALRSRM
jgi:hypothetical protein